MDILIIRSLRCSSWKKIFYRGKRRIILRRNIIQLGFHTGSTETSQKILNYIISMRPIIPCLSYYRITSLEAIHEHNLNTVDLSTRLQSNLSFTLSGCQGIVIFHETTDLIARIGAVLEILEKFTHISTPLSTGKIPLQRKGNWLSYERLTQLDSCRQIQSLYDQNPFHQIRKICQRYYLQGRELPERQEIWI